MKKFIAILLALIVVFSTSVVAFAADVYTCPTCSKKYEKISEYNACLESHASEGEEGTASVYECATCGKKYEDLTAYNACVDSHFNNVNYHYDKYVNLTIVEVISSFVDIFNSTGIADLFTNIFEKIFTLVCGAIEA